MLHIKQTIFDFESGNCWATCIACLLELPLEEVPNFCKKGSDTFDVEGRREDWFRRTVLWLRSKGWELFTFKWPVPSEMEMVPPDGLVLLTGHSPRNKEKFHVVIGKIITEYVQSDKGWGTTYKIYFEHDPHPDDTFLDSEPVEISLLVKMPT